MCQLDRKQQADAADIGDQRMARLHRAQAIERGGAQRNGALAESLLFDHFERCQRRCRADGALLVGVVAECAVGGDVEIASCDQCREREHRAAQPLAQDDHIRHDVVVLEGEHSAGPAKADRDLVQDHERAMAIAGVAHDPVVLGRRNLDVGRTHRLDHDRADVLLLPEHVVEVLGAAQVAATAAAETAAARVARWRVLGAREQGPDALAEHGFAADRDGVERGTMKAVPERQRLVASSRDPRKLERHADGERAAGGEQHFAEGIGRKRPRACARARSQTRW